MISQLRNELCADDIDDLIQKTCNSIAKALDLRLFRIKQSICCKTL